MCKTEAQNIGVIGAGFMAAPIPTLRQAAGVSSRPSTNRCEGGVATRTQGCADFAGNWGYESSESDWRKLIDRKDIDIIDIASPNDTHDGDRHRRGASRQDGEAAKSPWAATRLRPRRWSPGRGGQGAEHGLSTTTGACRR